MEIIGTKPDGKICWVNAARRSGGGRSRNVDNYIISGISVSLCMFLLDTRTLPLTHVLAVMDFRVNLIVGPFNHHVGRKWFDVVKFNFEASLWLFLRNCIHY